jgi:hypothetical protein
MDPKYLSLALLLATQVNWSDDFFIKQNYKEFTDQHVDGNFLKTFVSDFTSTVAPDATITNKLKDLADPNTTKTWADVHRKLFGAMAYAFSATAPGYGTPPCPKNMSVIIDAINSTPPLIPDK